MMRQTIAALTLSSESPRIISNLLRRLYYAMNTQMAVT